MMITAATIRRIRDAETDELPVISMYVTVPVDVGERSRLKTHVTSLLEQVRPFGEDHTLGHDARLSVRADLERIADLCANERWQPPAVAVFSCSGRSFLEEVQLPRRAGDRIVADATPWIRPMMAVLEEFHRAVVLVTDSNSARLWELFQGEFHQLRDIEHRALRKRNYAGWHGLREHSVTSKAEELEKRHYLSVVELLDEIFVDPSYELLILGGQHDKLSRLEARLPKRLRDRLAGTFTVDTRRALDADVRGSGWRDRRPVGTRGRKAQSAGLAVRASRHAAANCGRSARLPVGGYDGCRRGTVGARRGHRARRGLSPRWLAR
jgi:peptide chain release factor subunit 1